MDEPTFGVRVSFFNPKFEYSMRTLLTVLNRNSFKNLNNPQENKILY